MYGTDCILELTENDQRKDKKLMKNYRAVIFDLDGVLCSTDRYHYLAWKQLADKYGLFFDEEINNCLRGVSRVESLEIILERNNETSFSMIHKNRMLEEKNTVYCQLLEDMSEQDLTDEVKKTLGELRSAGVDMAVGSSSKNAKFILEKIGLGNFFEAVSDGTNIIHSKPDPEVFLKAAEMLGYQPMDCLVVEDAAAGIEAASRGGFDSAGLGEAALCSRTTWPLKRFGELCLLAQKKEK